MTELTKTQQSAHLGTHLRAVVDHDLALLKDLNSQYGVAVRLHNELGKNKRDRASRRLSSVFGGVANDLLREACKTMVRVGSTSGDLGEIAPTLAALLGVAPPDGASDAEPEPRPAPDCEGDDQT